MNKKLDFVNLISEVRFTAEDMVHQLTEDEKKYGDTWKERGLIWRGMDQETRFFFKVQEYYEDFVKEGVPMPWTKILGEAHICLVREKKLKESE